MGPYTMMVKFNGKSKLRPTNKQASALLSPPFSAGNKRLKILIESFSMAGLVVILSDADIHDLQYLVVSQCLSRGCCGVIDRVIKILMH